MLRHQWRSISRTRAKEQNRRNANKITDTHNYSPKLRLYAYFNTPIIQLISQLKEQYDEF